jgi:hypothetical protein
VRLRQQQRCERAAAEGLLALLLLLQQLLPKHL